MDIKNNSVLKKIFNELKDKDKKTKQTTQSVQNKSIKANLPKNNTEKEKITSKNLHIGNNQNLKLLNSNDNRPYQKINNTKKEKTQNKTNSTQIFIKKETIQNKENMPDSNNSNITALKYLKDKEIINRVDKYREKIKTNHPEIIKISISEIVQEIFSQTNINLTEERIINVLQNNYYYKNLLSGSQLFTNLQKPTITIKKTNQNSVEETSIKENYQEFKKEYDFLLKNSSTKEQNEYPSIGLDFGTSFTKVAFFNSNYDKGMIPFGNQSMKSSVIYTNQHSSILSMFPNDNANRKVNYFKATVINNSNYRSLSNYHSDFSFVASVFFVANIIKYIKLKLSDYLNSNIIYQVNMGIPTLDDCNITETYRKILHCAIIICENGYDIREVDSNTFKQWISKAEESYNSNLYEPGMGQHATFPELFAEALYLLERNDYIPGYYSIVDIGGGTTDMMLLKKYGKRDGQILYSCFYAVVKPIGNEVRKKIKKEEYEGTFLSNFNQMIMSCKNYADELGLIKTLLFGGGTFAEGNYYEHLIARNGLNRTQVSLSIEVNPFECNDINFIKDESIAERQSKSPLRFITAYRLAVNTGNGENLKMQKNKSF